MVLFIFLTLIFLTFFITLTFFIFLTLTSLTFLTLLIGSINFLEIFLPNIFSNSLIRLSLKKNDPLAFNSALLNIISDILLKSCKSFLYFPVAILLGSRKEATNFLLACNPILWILIPSGVLAILPKRKPIRRRKKPKQGYFIFEKRGGKFVKLKGLPLPLQKAKDRLAFRLDTKLSRTAKLKKVVKPKRLGKISKKEVGYFKRTRKQLRQFKIRKKRKFPLTLKYIEKRKFGLSTRGEVRQIQLNRRIKARRRKSKRSKVKRIRTLSLVKRSNPTRKVFRSIPTLTSSQLKTLRLRNLKKGRQTRLNNLKGRNQRKPINIPKRTFKVQKTTTPMKKRKVSQQTLDNLAKGRAKFIRMF